LPGALRDVVAPFGNQAWNRNQRGFAARCREVQAGSLRSPGELRYRRMLVRMRAPMLLLEECRRRWRVKHLQILVVGHRSHRETGRLCQPLTFLLVPKLHLGTQLSWTLCFL
jgi:hypothetical protein